jgi:hypothetical protein
MPDGGGQVSAQLFSASFDWDHEHESGRTQTYEVFVTGTVENLGDSWAVEVHSAVGVDNSLEWPMTGRFASRCEDELVEMAERAEQKREQAEEARRPYVTLS